MQTGITDFGLKLHGHCRALVHALGPLGATFIILLAMSPAGWADLPTPVDPDSGTAADGDFIDFFKYTVKDILLIAAVVISTVSFIIVSIASFMKFNEARRDRAEWGEVFTLVGVGAFLLVATGFLLNQTLDIIV